MEFQHRVAVVTGASSGIGTRCAEKLAERGARVVLFARSAEKLHAIAARHEDRMLAISGDVADEAAIARLFAETESRFGACDILINNAGMIDPKPMVATSADDWDRMFAEKFPGYVSYCASKGAVISMTEAMAVEVKSRGVRVNCVSPGSVDTKMWAEASGGAPADMTPDEVAETI